MRKGVSVDVVLLTGSLGGGRRKSCVPAAAAPHAKADQTCRVVHTAYQSRAVPLTAQSLRATPLKPTICHRQSLWIRGDARRLYQTE